MYKTAETAVLKVLSDILSAVDTGNLSMLTLLVLLAAFDTVDHPILLCRLQTSYGLGGVVHAWFRSYLANRIRNMSAAVNPPRHHCLCCSGCHSDRSSGRSSFCCTQRTWCVWLSPSDWNHISMPTTCRSTVHAVPVLQPTCRVVLLTASLLSPIGCGPTDKTEFLLCTSARRQHQLPTDPLVVGADSLAPASVVRDLGIYVDSGLSMRTHVLRTAGRCFAALRQIRSIRRSVTRPVLESLVVALVLSRLDYGCQVSCSTDSSQHRTLQRD